MICKCGNKTEFSEIEYEKPYYEYKTDEDVFGIETYRCPCGAEVKKKVLFFEEDFKGGSLLDPRN